MQATLSNARPEIGDYAFTTLRPQLGRVHSGGKHFMVGVHDSATVADIPGLIQGAHENRGLVRKPHDCKHPFCLLGWLTTAQRRATPSCATWSAAPHWCW